MIPLAITSVRKNGTILKIYVSKFKSCRSTKMHFPT